MTALYDAIGTSVTDLERNKGKEDKVLVTIITDGYENDSIEWDGASVKKLIDRLCKRAGCSPTSVQTRMQRLRLERLE